MENYVKVAIEAGLESLTFTEHAPLPMADPLPDKDSSMRPEDVDAYLAEVRTLAKKYQGIIEIHAGFELDYLEGKEPETRAFLEKYPETVPQFDPERAFRAAPSLRKSTLYRLGLRIVYAKRRRNRLRNTLHTLRSAGQKSLGIPVRRIDPEKNRPHQLDTQVPKGLQRQRPHRLEVAVG